MKTSIKIANLANSDIAYYDMDGGSVSKTILLIHGFASTAQVNWIGTGWAKLLNQNGYRVIAVDNRGHGQSSKFYRPEDYGPDIFAFDALQLLDQLEIERCDVLGYSMGARITCWLSYQAPERVRRAVYGGMGGNIFGNRGGYELIAKALEADDPTKIEGVEPLAFRKFADVTRSDRLALAACIRPSLKRITREIVESVSVPTLVAVGSEDHVGGSAEDLAAMMPNAEAYTIQGMDHMKATGAADFKDTTIQFLNRN